MKYLGVLGSILLFFSCQIEPPQLKALALVVGGADYDNNNVWTDLNDLPGARNDAEAMAYMFDKKGYEVWLRLDSGNPGQFTTLTNGISNKQAGTKNQIKNIDFPAIPGAMADKDLFIFYYSGHGGHQSDPINYTENGSPTYLIFNGSVTGSIDYTKALADYELGALIKSLPANIPKLIIIDACYSGGFVGDSAEKWTAPIDTNNPNGVGVVDNSSIWSTLFNTVVMRDIPSANGFVLTAATDWEKSWEATPASYLPEAYFPNPAPVDGYKNRGVFTLGLQNAIAGGADLNKDQLVSADEAYNFVKQYIDKYWNNRVAITQKFTPTISGGRVNFVISKTGN